MNNTNLDMTKAFIFNERPKEIKDNLIIAERKEESLLDKFDIFCEAMSDGRLTKPSDGKVYRLREAILLSKKLGRLLSKEEMKQFEI